MKNQVIKVLSREHGEKVIQYWKDRGIDIKGFAGNMSNWYYGVIDGEFNIYGPFKVAKADAEIITLPEELPEKWFIVPTEDTVKDICRWFDENHSDDCNFYSNELRIEIAYTNAFNKSNVYYSAKYLINQDVPQITFEQFKQITKMKEEKKILIGYRLVKKEYEKAAARIVHNNRYDSFESHIPYTIGEDSNAVRILKEAEVLDLWFEPIYEEDKPELPKINGYEGVFSGDCIIYGCAQLYKEWFTSTENRHIRSITLSSGVVINKEQMEQIRKVIDYHSKK